MSMRRARLMTRLTALMAGAALLFSAGACSNRNSAPLPEPNEADPGDVAIFTPDDGFTFSQSTPLNTWAKLVPDVVAALKDKGMDAKSIDTSTASSLDEQSTDVQDYVVEMLSKANEASDSAADGDDGNATADADARAALSKVTLVVAPVSESDKVTQQYGDFASQPIDAEANEELSSEAVSRLVSALRLARESGMHVVLLSNPIAGAEVDAFVSMSTASLIGRTQAERMVGKLQLDKASKDNPKAIEVMLPVDLDSDASQRFAQEAFEGVWQVLQPYFADGRAVSPSGLLDAKSTAEDWRDVAFQATSTEQVAKETNSRLSPAADEADDDDSEKADADTSENDESETKETEAKAGVAVDGIIAMNDFVASTVSQTLAKLGYTGSAADINPTITISGIVGNITGKKDLKRSQVPDPIKSPDKDPAAGTDGNGQETEIPDKDAWKRWPLVTGFGGYVDVMPQIVDGKQWMTGLENRQSLAKRIAGLSVRLNEGKPLKDLTRVETTKVTGVDTPTLSLDLLAVSASNLKESLIDPGYITPAEAGL